MLVSPKPFRVIFGSAEDGLMKVVVWSLSNSDFTLTVGDQTVTVKTSGGDATWVSMGTDHPTAAFPEACFVANGLITIPTTFQILNWTATQDGNTESHTIPTQPGMYDDHRTLEWTCNYYDGYDDVPSVINGGCWPLVKQLMEDTSLPPVVASVATDDISYIDTMSVNDSITGKATTGNPQTTLTQFDYALAWASSIGGLCQDSAGGMMGLEEGQQYCLDNARQLWIWGNHELEGGIARTNGTATINLTRPNSFHATGTEGVDTPGDGAGKLVWEAMVQPLTGNKLGSPRDSTSKHWYENMGCRRLVFTDCITNHAGTVTIFGNNQIDDCLEMLDTPLPFKTLYLGQTPRAFSDGSAAKEEIFPVAQLEYERTFTATGSTPKSIMDNPWTNGVYGNLDVVQGDMHFASVKWMYKAAYTGNAAEGFLNINLGSITRTSALHGFSTAFLTGADDTTGEIVAEYMRDRLAGYRGPHLLERIVYASEQPPRQHLRFWRETTVKGEFEIAYETHIVQHWGNRGMTDKVTPKFGVNAR